MPDSLQLYDGLPILTAQPSERDKRSVSHRLYAALAPQDSCDAVKWRGLALVRNQGSLGKGSFAYRNGREQDFI
jgi:tRNA dimethylallyltransferase